MSPTFVSVKIRVVIAFNPTFLLIFIIKERLRSIIESNVIYIMTLRSIVNSFWVLSTPMCPWSSSSSHWSLSWANRIYSFYLQQCPNTYFLLQWTHKPFVLHICNSDHVGLNFFLLYLKGEDKSLVSEL